MPRERSGPLDAEGLDALLGLMLDPTPATHVRIVLREYRRRDWDFEQAWAQAMRTLPRTAPEIEDWRALFHESKEQWRECYSAQPGAPQIDPLVFA